MRIRFFNTFEPVNTLYEDLLPELIRQGHQVTLVVSKAEYRGGRNIVARYGDQPDIRLQLISSFGVQPRGRMRKSFVHFTYAIGAAIGSLFGRKVDVNVFLTQPPFFGIWAPFLKFFRRQPYCCATMDSYPGALVVRSSLANKSLITRMLNRLCVFYLNRAKSVLVLGRCMRAELQRMGVTREIDVIPYWVNQHSILPTDPATNEMRSDLGWSDKFVVYYGGNFGYAAYLDDYLGAASRLSEHKEILFVLMGSGSHEQYLRDIVSTMPGANIEMLPFMHDRYSLATAFSASDIHFVSYTETHTGIGVPTKAYAAMASGRPFISQSRLDGEVGMLIAEENIGIAIREGDVDGLCNAVLRLYQSPDLRNTMSRNCRTLAETTHSVENGVAFYCKAICGNDE